MSRQDNLLSIVVGLEDVADGSAVGPPANRVQNKTKQPLVVLMGRALNHAGERELQQEGDERDDWSINDQKPL